MKLYEKIVYSLLHRRSRQAGESASSEGCSLREDTATAAIESSGLGLYSYNVTSNELVMNKAMFKMLGVQPYKKALKFSLEALNVHSADRAAFEGSLHTAIATSQTWLHEFRVELESTEVSHIRISAEVHRSHKATVLTGAAIDITLLVQSIDAAKEVAGLKIRHADDQKHQQNMNSMIRTI
jgi:PAS domain-containing protein